MDAVAVAKIVPGTESDSDAQFAVQAVIRGDSLVRPKQELRINYFGKAQPQQSFLIMGVDPPDLLWSSPLPVSDVAIRYVEAIHHLPESSLERLKFYMQYLEHPESLLARDAYDEFASAPYQEIKALKPNLNREQLIEWIQDSNLPPDRKRLYLVMLGICGQKSDAKLLESMLRSDDPNRRAGLDALIACYVTLQGEDGLDLIDELFLANDQSQYADTYAAIMALRFHGTDGGVIEKDRVLKSMRLILDRPELADLVIPDLARWEDWSQIDKLAELFKSADEKSSWVRVPVINYLRACPLPEAVKTLDSLKELDPAAYKRATSFFPIPKASSDSSSDSSSMVVPDTAGGLAQDFDAPQMRGDKAVTLAAAVTRPDRLSASLGPAAAASRGTSQIAQLTGPNRLHVISVLSMTSVSLWLAMWLAISGAGNSPWLSIMRVRQSFNN